MELETGRAGPWSSPGGRSERRLLSQLQARLDAIASRLSAVEQPVGSGADTRELDQQLGWVLGEMVAAVDAQEYEQAASLRDRERQLLVEKARRQQEWQAATPGLPLLAERCSELGEELDRLRALPRGHDIEPEDKTARPIRFRSRNTIGSGSGLLARIRPRYAPGHN